MQTTPRIHMIGNAHIDPAWLWKWQDGFAEIKATFRSALDRIEEFPDFVFTCAGSAYYRWVEENAPEMFAEIRRRVSEGRWVLVGGWWLQPDCNLPSGESFARHSLYGQGYLFEKFGCTARIGYNVDSFGHNGMIPQLMVLSGMDSYVFMRPFQSEKALPSNLFWWEGIDGSRVLTFRIPPVYSTEWNVSIVDKMESIKDLALVEGVDQMCFYGVGNHGGGPTVRNVEEIAKWSAQSDGASFFCSSPDRYFMSVSARSAEIPVVRGELQHHAVGCYSAHSETKAFNRRAEHRLLACERFAALAFGTCALTYPAGRIREAWESVLFNQFHDILGGCSIREVCEDARDAYGHALHVSAQVLNSSLQKISWSVDTLKAGVSGIGKDKHWRFWEQGDLGTPIVVFNPHPWEATVPVEFPHRLAGLEDDLGNPLAIQHVRASRTNVDEKYDTLAMVRLPALGYRLHWAFLDRKHELPKDSSPGLVVSEDLLENEYVRVRIDRVTGSVLGLLDKKRGVEMLDASGSATLLIDEEHADTWAHEEYEFRKEAGRFGNAHVQVLETGPLRARIRTTSCHGASTLQQDFILHHDRPELQVKAKLDLREHHKMVKLSFKVGVLEPIATYEVPYGHLVRPGDGREEVGQQWVDVSGVSTSDALPLGLGLLNDGKYSFDVKDNDLRMTVARSAMFAEHRGQRDAWNEFMDQGIQYFSYALVPHSGDWRNARMVQKALELNLSPEIVVETYHAGFMPSSLQGMAVSAPSVVATVFKRSEDGEGYVVRAYETNGRAVSSDFAVPFLGRSWTTSFRPLEIKTFLIPDDPAVDVEEIPIIERPPAPLVPEASGNGS